jgi:hypothetical protein
MKTHPKSMAQEKPEDKKVFSDWEIVQDSIGIDVFLPAKRCNNSEDWDGAGGALLE